MELADLVGEQLREQGLWDLYWNLERPLIDVLVEMQSNGIRVDAAQLARTKPARRSSGSACHQSAIFTSRRGREFNIDSPKQLQQVLFVELKLPVIRKTKTGASTDQEVLEQLALHIPCRRCFYQHRTLTKLKGTYLDALPEMINPETGKIHTSFNQVVAATGRLSSSDPNLQNIPVRTEEGRRVRQAFIPSQPDWRLLCADYSQIELRMLAHFSGDTALCAAFAQGGDIHTAVAAEVFGVAPEAVDGEMRRVAKAVNFGVIYGQSPFGLSAALGISQAEAAKFIDGYFARYAGVDRYLESLLSEIASQRLRDDDSGPPAGDPGNPPRATTAIASATCPSGPPSTRSSRARPPISSNRPCSMCSTACGARSIPDKCSCKFTTSWCSKRRAIGSPIWAILVREEMEGALPLGRAAESRPLGRQRLAEYGGDFRGGSVASGEDRRWRVARHNRPSPHACRFRRVSNREILRIPEKSCPQLRTTFRRFRVAGRVASLSSPGGRCG